jgi:guanylate kinase
MAGKLVIFSAPSGAGKTTIIKELLKRGLSLEFSISATTRERRPNEQFGKDYYFLSVEDFKNKIKKNEFVEWEEVYTNNFYGTLEEEIERIWSQGNHVIFDVDVDGGINLKKTFGDRALAVFVKPPSLDALRERLTGRDTETKESVERRMAKAPQELEKSKEFDYVLLNDNLERAIVHIEDKIKTFLTQS